MSYSAEVLADSPVAYWRLGDPFGIDAADEQDNAPGIYENTPTFGVTGALSGDSNKAITLNGTDEYISVAHVTDLNVGDTFTLECWVKPAAFVGPDALFDKATDWPVVYLTAAGQIRLDKGAGATLGVSDAAVSTGVWQHIVITKNGSTVKFYLDGVDVTPVITNATMGNNTSPLALGASSGGAGNFFNGSLDEVAVYATALSAARVLAHYEASFATQEPPRVRVYAAFGELPDSPPYTWTEITGAALDPSKAAGFTYSRGRNEERGKPETGTSRISFHDQVSAFDPNNPDSPYYPDLVPVTPIKATITVNGTDYPLFQHFVEWWQREQRIGAVYTRWGIDGSDGFEALAAASLADSTFALERSDVRVENILDAINWPSTARAIGTGQTDIETITFAESEEAKALPHLLDAVIDTEEGLVFVNATGDLVFIGRHKFLSTDSVITFSDNPSDGEYPYVQLVPSQDVRIVNDWRGTRPNGTGTVRVEDAGVGSSQERYRRRTDQLTSLVTTDRELEDQLAWRLTKTKDPHTRVESITVMPGTNIDMWAAVLSLEIGNRITIEERPPGYSAARVDDYHIHRLDVQIAVDIVSSKFTFGLFPAEVQNFWQLEHPVRGEIDSLYKLAY